jgi:signal transduction histidine kinase
MYIDGAPILRLPKFGFSTYSNSDEYDTLELVAHAESGAYIGRSRYDGISRLTAFEKFNDEQPLFLYYSRTTDAIFREWQRTYIATGLLLTVMWVTKIYTIVTLHRRRHQMAAEGLEAASRARMEALGRLAGGVAHDINGILQIITGAGDIMLRRRETRAEVERLCGVILRTARRGSAVTRRLLTFARQDMLSPTDIDLDVLLKEISELLDPLLGELVRLNYVAPSVDLPRIRADRSQLETVLINLATNSRDAMPTGGIVNFAASPDFERKMVRIDVSDNGVGLAPEVLVRAMEPYYSTKKVNEGIGLSLAMAKGFVEQSGGDLDIQTEQGVGTTVSLWMPMSRDPESMSQC